MAQYPTLRLLERHGGWLAAVIAAIPLFAGVAATISGQSAWWILAGIAGSSVLFVAARSYVEMIRLMTDMLLPK
jgi:hypothetical protein